MFQRSLRSIFLFVTLGLAAAAPARAALDVDDITLTVTVARTSLGQDDITAVLRVTGTDLNNGTVELPSAPGSQIQLDKVDDDLVLGIDFDDELQLNAVLPSGTYILRFNNNSVQVNVTGYSRPAVPLPDISQPEAGDVLLPGPVEVLFTNCGICSQVGDSVEAVLEDDAENVLAEETLTSSSESWIPDDGLGGDLPLPPNSAFVTRITHTTVRQSNPTIDDVDDVVVFSGIFIRSDEIDFETGFEPPTGTVCLALNHPAPPAGCTELSNPLFSIVDSTGSFTTQIDGHDVDVTLTVEPGGSLSGEANADLDDSGVNETGPAPIKGKLGGGQEERGSKLSCSLANEGLAAKLKLSVTDEFLILADTRNRTVRGSGSLNGVKIKEETLSSDSPIPTPLLGWYVTFDVDGSSDVANAMLVLEGGRSFGLTGTNKFNVAADESGMKLVSDPKGITIQLKKLLLGDADPLPITGGDLSYKMLGQSGKVSLEP